jgi:hypothetical protein
VGALSASARRRLAARQAGRTWDHAQCANPIRWSPALPTVDHPDSQPEQHSAPGVTAYTLWVPSAHLSELEQIRRDLSQGGRLILMNDRCWSMTYRMPVPNERLIKAASWR